MQVTVDGVEYAPVGSGGLPRIGVAVATFDRQSVLEGTIARILKHTPGAYLVVVDDHSPTPVTVPDGVELVRLPENRGVAGAKNACLAALMAAGCEHLFLFDDDAYPLKDGWWRPYVESPEPHLMAVFDKPKGAQKTQVEVLYEDDRHVYYHATRGYMLYVERRVVEAVGGMDRGFGKWGWEHASWSDRIHAAGFTTSRYMDVKGSQDLIYSMDQAGEISSTVTEDAKRFSEGPGFELRMESRHDPRFIEYRDLEDVVLTCMLSAQPDPQRGRVMAPKADAVKALHDSLPKQQRFVLLTTGLEGTLPRAEVVQVSQSINPYFQRWVSIYQWLRAHPEIGRVWCVDATDVTMTRDPFPEMEPGRLYFGYEPTTLRDEWMLKQHPDTTLQEFMKSNPNLPLLNMGVVGGDRETVMAFAQKVTKFYFDDQISWIYGWETERVGTGDMATGNYVARTEFGEAVSSGPHVTSVFKADKASPTAWWKHK